MANDILITPGDATIDFDGSTTGTINIAVDEDGTVRFAGASGALLTIADDLSDILFAVSDGSGISFIESRADGRVLFDPLGTDITVGLGTDTPLGTFHISTGSSGQGTPDSSADEFIIESDASGGMSILTTSADTGSIYFGDESDADVGGIKYLHTSDYMRFRVDGADVLDILDTGILRVTTADYETVVSHDDDIITKKWAEDNITNVDKVDGLDADQFLRSDAADTTTGTITIQQNAATMLILDRTTLANSVIQFGNTSHTTFLGVGGADGELKIGTTNDVINLGSIILTQADEGSGNGLDADTVDALEASQFLRSDTDDSFSGVLTSTVATENAFLFDSGDARITVHDGQGDFNILFGADNADNYTDTSHGAVALRFDGVSADGSFSIDTAVQGTSGNPISWTTGLVISGPTFSFAGNTIWHAGNDGSGSGLDADTVDGIQVSNLLRSDTNDSTSGTLDILTTSTEQGLEIASGDNSTAASGYVQISLGFNGLTDNYRHNIRTRHNNGGQVNNYIDFFLWKQGTDAVGDLGSQHVFRIGYDTSTFTLSDNDGLKVNTNTVWHAGNDGTGTGMDSDLLDGLEATSFVRTDADSTISSNVLNFGSDYRQMINLYSTTQAIGAQTNTPYIRTPERFSVFAGGSHSDTENDANGGTVLFTVKDTGDVIEYKGNTVWHSGNDGTGSTLDADLLDSLEATSFVRTDADSDIATNTLSFGSSTRQMINLWGTSYGIGVQASTAYVRTDKRFSVFDGGTHNASENNPGGGTVIFTVEGGTNTIEAFGSTVWHAGNDGTGSTLDADLLDGVEGANYVRTDQSTTIGTGDITLTIDRDTEVSGHALRLLSNNQKVSLKMGDASNPGNYGFYWEYDGTGSGADNTLSLWSDNQAGTDLQIWEVDQDGAIDFKINPTINGAAVASGDVDAATLDTLDSTQFLRSDTADSFSGTLTGNAKITFSGSNVLEFASTNTRDKIRLYGADTQYTIGMQPSTTYGFLNDLAMTFQMNNSDNRGFWWGDTGHSVSQGAMSLTTDGRLTVDKRIEIGISSAASASLFTDGALRINAGNESAGTSNYKHIMLNYGVGANEYGHAIATRHNGSDDDFNRIVFAPWNTGLAGSESEPVITTDQAFEVGANFNKSSKPMRISDGVSETDYWEIEYNTNTDELTFTWTGS